MSTEPLRPGDPVTLVMVDHVVMVTVAVATMTGFSCKLSTRGGKTIDSPWKLDEEGVGWLRGYHVADSPGVKACQTAQALLPKKKIGSLSMNPAHAQAVTVGHNPPVSAGFGVNFFGEDRTEEDDV